MNIWIGTVNSSQKHKQCCYSSGLALGTRLDIGISLHCKNNTKQTNIFTTSTIDDSHSSQNHRKLSTRLPTIIPWHLFPEQFAKTTRLLGSTITFIYLESFPRVERTPTHCDGRISSDKPHSDNKGAKSVCAPELSSRLYHSWVVDFRVWQHTSRVHRNFLRSLEHWRRKPTLVTI